MRPYAYCKVLGFSVQVCQMKILYIGPISGTCLQRAEALRRLGHQIQHLDPWSYLPHGKFTRRLIGKFVTDIGAGPLEGFVSRGLLRDIRDQKYDLAWIDNAALIGPRTIRKIRHHAPLVISYTIDDPFGGRDRRKWDLYKAALPDYDLVSVARKVNVDEAVASGARKVIFTPMTADELAHAPLALTREDWKEWASDVSFIGTWMPERGPFLLRLLELGVPLTLYGPRWDKAPEWPRLQSAFRKGALLGNDYIKAIQTSKICIGLLSKGNRDLHTTRSTEIPSIGSLLCAERTSEHLDMYLDGEEAVFWETPEQCAKLCLDLLNNPERLDQITKAGHARCIANQNFNEPQMARILSHAIEGHIPVQGQEPRSARNVIK